MISQAYEQLLEFAIEIPMQQMYWSNLSISNSRFLYNSDSQIHKKLEILNRLSIITHSVLGHFYHLKKNNIKSPKLELLLNDLVEIVGQKSGGKNQDLIGQRIKEMPEILEKIKRNYFRPSFLRRNWFSIFLISITGTWVVVKVFKSRDFILFAVKELKSTALQLMHVWIWEPIKRIYETIR